MPKKPGKQSSADKRHVQYNNAIVQFGSADTADAQSELQTHLCGMAREISAGLSDLHPLQSKELLGAFASELFLCVAEEDRRKVRRRQQAEGIARAKARGVRFGPEAKPLPDNFPACYQSWQDGEITAVEAAQTCGMSRKSFYRAVARAKESAGCGA